MTPTRTRTYAKRRWNVATASDLAAELGRALGTTTATAQILINRGFSETDRALAFLKPTLRDLHDPSLLPGVPAAADRLARAIRDKESIVIYGDYDVDGITASAILWHSIKALGHTARCYVPHRIDEGYGVNADAVRQLCDDGVQLIVTVDCGITAIEPTAIARERGVDVIITDHHEWKGGPEPLLPAATAIVHPRLPAEAAYPNPHLCGAGVAFKLAWGVGQMIGSGFVGPEAKAPPALRDALIELTSLAALGTIADVVPLVGENRALAQFGLIGLKASNLHGIRALIAACDLDGKKLDSFHVGFLLGPRLNAAGRMGHAKLAVEMLTEASPSRADEIATFLESQNRQRQITEREIVGEAIRQAEDLGLCDEGCHAIVVGSANWHPGVIGIVASRLVDRFHKPTIVIALGEDGGTTGGHGSGRSIAGFHLAKALDACKAHLKTCGGHEMAAGLKIDPQNLVTFRDAFLDYAKMNLTPDQLVPELRIDAIAALGDVSHAFVDELARLGPFGNGNPRPMIACRGVELTAPPRTCGKKGEHVQLFLHQNGTTMKAIAFNAAAMLDDLNSGRPLNLAVQPTLNEWNGKVSVELEVKDISLAE
jgi:single-stranded-DNA-specific exonuclease